MTTENLTARGGSFCMILLMALLSIGFIGGLAGLIILFCNCFG